MNYLKVLIQKTCGYLIDVFFPTKNTLTTHEILATIPESTNTHPFIHSLLCYKNSNMKKIIKLIKYKGDIETTEIVSKILYDYILEDLSEKNMLYNFTNPIILPIPATQRRIKEYGFNQCERIVKSIIKTDKNNYFEAKYDILVKKNDTESQAHIKNKLQRIKNIKNSFCIEKPHSIENRNIILIDDVWTTGATLEEACKEILDSGAKKVLAYTIAH